MLDVKSLPIRGVWIEMFCVVPALRRDLRHSPHGECGLKHARRNLRVVEKQSLPMRGARVVKYSLQQTVLPSYESENAGLFA